MTAFPRPRPLRAELAHISAHDVHRILSFRLNRTVQRVRLVERAAAYVLAASLQRSSTGALVVAMTAAELARFIGVSERHAQRARTNLVAAGIFREIARPREVGTVVLELPRTQEGNVAT